jgi:hypothetical protein
VKKNVSKIETEARPLCNPAVAIRPVAWTSEAQPRDRTEHFSVVQAEHISEFTFDDGRFPGYVCFFHMAINLLGQNLDGTIITAWVDGWIRIGKKPDDSTPPGIC